MPFSEFDHRCMARALQLAERGLTTTDPNPRVGCVITHEPLIVGEGWHKRAGEPHAEVLALRAAGEKSRGACAYVTLEPCSHFGRTPPCTDALVKAGVRRVICSMIDPNPRVRGSGIERLRAAGVVVETGLCEADARTLNCGYVRRFEQGLPWVRIKLGASLDGRIALANGESRWVTGEEARMDVQHWRARSSAILTGSGTVLTDDPRLDVRTNPPHSEVRQPLRVIVDTDLRTPKDAKILDQPGAVLIFAATASASRRAELDARGVQIETIARSRLGVDLELLMRRLTELEINEVWVEAGARLAGALLEAGLVNELVIYFAPCVLGSDARGMFDLPELTTLEQRRSVKFTDVRMIGGDVRIMAECGAAGS